MSDIKGELTLDQLAAQAWCFKETAHIEMNTELAKAFAFILHQQVSERDAIQKEEIERLITSTGADHARRLSDTIAELTTRNKANNDLIKLQSDAITTQRQQLEQLAGAMLEFSYMFGYETETINAAIILSRSILGK